MRRNWLGNPKLSSKLHLHLTCPQAQLQPLQPDQTLQFNLEIVTQPLLANVKPVCLQWEERQATSFIVLRANRLTTGSPSQGLTGQ